MNYICILCGVVLVTAACDYSEPQIKNSDVIKNVTFEKPSLEADGMSHTKVMVELADNAEAGKRTVEISTTAGTFAETDKKNVVSVNAEQVETGGEPYQLIAHATLVSALTEGDLTVTARTNGFVQSKSYSFAIAYPETITIVPEKLVLKRGVDMEFKVTVVLTRNSGAPTLNRTVALTVKDAGGNQVGKMREPLSPSDATGKCYGTFALTSTTYVSPLTIEATTDNVKPTTETIYIQ